MQYDLSALDPNTGAPTIVQEYDQHLGPVNTVTFVDEGRRFVSTSDDKTLRVWEFGIPVVIKYVAEPAMHSMPAVAMSPSKKWLACTSLDNQIVVYSARDRFSLNRKKRFAGHVVAGYACQPAFSADGRFVVSGDGEGKVWAWDWKTTKIIK
ncbi:pre-mRNA-processing factor 17 [Gonapodya sp. JEL0774]|nr:pre-mRNA-processing factor 17 [Gonapodya sp. JEL0774]